MSSAFPYTLVNIRDGHDIRSRWETGLSKRELFAAVALHAIISKDEGPHWADIATEKAVEHADKLMRALEKETSP